MEKEHDILSLPFDKLNAEIDTLANERYEQVLESLKAEAGAKNKKLQATIARELAKYNHPEEGSDGLEEAAYEMGPGYINIDKLDISEEAKDEILENAKEAVAKAFINRYNLGSGYNWWIPQLIAYFGREWKAIKIPDSELYSAKLTFEHNVSEPDSFAWGAHFLSMLPRGKLGTMPVNGGKMKDPQVWYKLNTINHFVPLILAGFKKYQNIPYNAWNRTKALSNLVDYDLYTAMLSEPPKNVPKEVLLKLRDHFLENRGEKQKKASNSPISHSKVSHRADWDNSLLDITKISNMGLQLLCQTWGAHPENRNTNGYQILDSWDWDNVPEPLVATEVKKPVTWKYNKNVGDEL